MAKTLVQEAVNYFIWVKVESTYVMVGCANSITEEETSNEISINCDGDGTDPLTFYGTSNKKLTIGGVYFTYDTNDETTNFSIADFRAARRAKTKLDIRIGSSATVATTVVQDYTGCMISSINVSSKNGGESTYNISLSADAVATTTIS